MRAPIVLFVYNRPAHTRQTIAALQANHGASDSDLFIYSDAARNADSAAGVAQVREYVRSVGGFKSVTIHEQTENRGLARSVIQGVTQVTAKYGRAIVLEDDLRTSPNFLDYMNTGLNRYAGDDRIMQIAGYMFAVDLKIDEDALFLPFISSWGWATWDRAWRHFDRREDCFEQILNDPDTRRRFDLNGRYKYSRILRAQQRKTVDSWAVFWYVSVFLRNGLALFPKKTLVTNLGFDGTGVNCAVSKFDQEELDPTFRVNVLPPSIELSPHAGSVIDSIPATRLSFTSLLNKLVRRRAFSQ
jgi:hypothetical protein